MIETTRVCYDSYTQAANQYAALRACCSSPDHLENSTITGSKSGPIARSAPPLRDITLNGSPTRQWPSPGNASAPVSNTPTPGHGYAFIPPTFQRRRCLTRHQHRRCCIHNATTPLACSPTSEGTRHVESRHVPLPVDLCAHGSTADVAEHTNR
ncbi:hypothetical protein MRX96_040781 [Rhipicephalus microplus]